MEIQTDSKPIQINKKVENLTTNLSSSPKTRQKNTSISITEIKSEIAQFKERHHLNLDEELDYLRNEVDPGRIIIFNNEQFEKEDFRHGSRRDVNEIIVCFSRLGFNVFANDICIDFTAIQIQEKIDQVLSEKEALRETNSLIVFVLTHGRTDDKLVASKDTSFSTSDIWTKFAQCEDLKNKPKMFIFQACKGLDNTTVFSPDIEKDNITKPTLVDSSYFSVNKLGSDMLIAYATSEGNVSYRDSMLGSWYIQELCRNFSTYGRRDDVITLLTRVSKCIAGNYYVEETNKKSNPPSSTIEKQMPTFVSTLSKKFYLNRSKERHILLKIQKDTEEIHDAVEKLVNRLKS